MDIHQIISELGYARSSLADLAVDPQISHERFDKCNQAVHNLETVIAELLGTAWIPKSKSQLFTSLHSVNKNIKRVRSNVAAALDVVLLDCKPDELFRGFIGIAYLRLLEWQRDVLMQALINVNVSGPTNGWIN